MQIRAARRDAMLMGDPMRRAFEDFLRAERAARPVVVVLEDLHWGDLPTVSFVDSARRAPTCTRSSPAPSWWSGWWSARRATPSTWKS